MTPTSREMSAALQLIDEGFDKSGWHGPNLLGSLKGMTLAELLFRPAPDAHNAWELALHSAYWKHVIRRRLRPEHRAGFPLPGSNFFRRDPGESVERWKEDLALLKRCHAELRLTVASLKVADFNRKLPASRHTYRRTIFGIAAHDIYHAGQISLLQKLARA